MYLCPQALLTAEQACRRVFSLKKKTPLLEMSVLLYFYFFLCFYIFVTTPNRRGMKNHFRNWSIFVLSCHIDPIGDRNDV